MKCPKCQTDNPSDSKYCRECAAPLPSSKEIPVTETLETPTEELTRGTTFANRYEIIEELGKGGMGKVYRVEDKKIKEEVALKLIKPEIASDKKTIERFSNELKMARKIRHKNVCAMYDLGEEKGIHYITMEYVPGEDLKGSIRRMGPLTAGKTLYIAKQICEGLAEAHRLGVVHRDLKPQNIMIDKEGNARIMDFGIARSVKGKGITGAGVMVGTPEYMSPEQAEVKEVDQRSDIYSLGVILYEMVTGRVPFEGETPLGIGYMNLEEWDKSIEQFQWHIQNKVEYYQPYVNLADSYMAKGLYEKAREVLEYYLDNQQDHPGIHHTLARNYLCQGKYDLALAEAEKGLALNPAFYLLQRVKADIYHCQGNLAEAEKEYQRLIEYKEPAAHSWGLAKLASLYLTQGRFKEAQGLLERGIDWSKNVGEKWAESNFHWYLGYAHLKSGNPEMALKEFEDALSGYVEAASLGGQRFVLCLKGVAYLEMNSTERAQMAAAELKKLIDEGMNRKAIRYQHHLIGRIELQKENFAIANENFQRAISLLSSQYHLTGDRHALFIEPLALAFYKQGELEKAQEEYERIISLTSGRLGFGDIYARSHFMLGKIFERKGWEGKAIEQYEKFLDLWKDADPGMSEVEDAKKRLTNLKDR